MGRIQCRHSSGIEYSFFLPAIPVLYPHREVRQRGALQLAASMELSLDSTDKELVLDLLRTLRGTAAAAPAPAAPRAAANDRAGRAKEALADERAARKKAAANAALLKQEPAGLGSHAWIHRAGVYTRSPLARPRAPTSEQELAAASATSVAAAAKAAAAAAPRGTSVRLVLCSAERPTERKIVVLPRSAGVDEVLKMAKAKLRLKRPPPGALPLTRAQTNPNPNPT